MPGTSPHNLTSQGQVRRDRFAARGAIQRLGYSDVMEATQLRVRREANEAADLTAGLLGLVGSPVMPSVLAASIDALVLDAKPVEADWQEHSYRSVGSCGRCRQDGVDEVGVRLVEGDDSNRAYLDGVQHCGSVSLCRVCSATIRGHRALEVAAIAAAHAGAGGKFSMLTLTIVHSRDDPLVELYAAVKGSWRSFQQSKRFRHYRRQLAGQIVTTEITLGDNGWHVHLHVLLLWEPGLFASEGKRRRHARGFVRWGERAWADQVERRTGKRPNGHGFDLRTLPASAATYVAKIASESTRADYKTRDALTVITDGVQASDPVAIARWREWVSVMKGKRVIVFSDGLRARYLTDENGDEIASLTDEEVVGQDRGGRLVGTIASDVSARLLGSTRAAPVPAICVILETVERFGSSPLVDPAEEPERIRHCDPLRVRAAAFAGHSR